MDIGFKPDHSSIMQFGDEPGLSLEFIEQGRELLRFMPSGEVIFDDRDVEQIVATFWRWATRLDQPPARTLTLTTEADGAAVTLHRNGDVTGENYTPDERALKLWGRIAAAWPK